MKMFSNGVGMIPSTLKLDFRYLNSTPYHLQRQHLALSPQQNLGTMYHSLSFFTSIHSFFPPTAMETLTMTLGYLRSPSSFAPILPTMVNSDSLENTGISPNSDSITRMMMLSLSLFQFNSGL